jgi:hypothetical protein
MSVILLTERHVAHIAGVLSCYDRVIVQGTLPVFCYADGMTAYLTKRSIRIFDFTQFAKPLTDSIKANAEAVAAANGLQIDYVRRKNFRKEDKVKAVLKERGGHPGLVWIFSALEPCTTYQPWHDKKSGRTYLRYDDGKCLHYYFYFIDEELGLCYVRVPTWCPFRLQFYCNGHNWLARQLDRKKIRYTQVDNAFTAIEDWAAAQQLADSWDPASLHRKLDEFAQRYCPILQQIEETYHWSLDEAEYSTDIVFHRQADLQAIYGHLIRTAIHTVKPDDIATFLGKKLNGNYQDEMGNRYNVRIEGTRVRHSMGMASIKMYDKFGQILRIETTAKDISFFKHYREVEQRNGESVMKFAPMKKTIYSLGALPGIPVGHRRPQQRHRQAQQNHADRSRGGAVLPRVQLLRSGRRSSLSGSRPRRVRHQWCAEQDAARQVPAVQRRSDVQNSTQASHPRTHQKGKSLLQVLPHGAGQTGRRVGPQTQGTCHYSGTYRCTRSLIFKILPISAKT